MRTLILSLIFIGVASYGTKMLLDNFADDTSDFFKNSYNYPDAIKITNRDGTEISITLLGRSAHHLEFKKNDREFVYPIDLLSADSKTLVMKYPENGIKNMEVHLSSGAMELNDVYVLQLEDQVRKLRREVQELVAKANATQSEAEKRTYERKIEKLQNEIAVIEAKIASRE